MKARLQAGLVLAGLVLTATRARAAGPWASTYFGGTGDDVVTTGRIDDDGGIVIGGSTTDGTSLPSKPIDIGAGTGGFLAKLATGTTSVQWIVSTPSVRRVLLAEDHTFVLSTNNGHIIRISADHSRVVWDHTLDAANIAVASGGDLVLLSGGGVMRVAADGVTSRFSTPIAKSRVVGLAVNPTTDEIFVAGDNNTNTGQEPWRSPFIYRFDGKGTKTGSLFDWNGPAVRANGLQLQADSGFDGLFVGSDGSLWAAGFADGGNTVLGKLPTDLTQDSPALVGACHNGPCFGWKGANKPRFLARVAADFSGLERASFFLSHQRDDSTPCTCSGTPNGGGPSLLVPSGDQLIGVGATAYSAPIREPWYSQVLYGSGQGTPNTGGGYPTLVTLFDRDLKTVSMSTAIPATNGAKDMDLRGGRLLIVGEADDLTGLVPPTGKESWPKVLPTLPSAGPLQANYGGGKSDGYVFVACVGTDAGCDAPPPPNTNPQRPPAPGGSGGAGTTGSAGGAGAVGAGGSPASGGGTTGSGASSGSSGCGCRLTGPRQNQGAGLVTLVTLVTLFTRVTVVRRRRNTREDATATSGTGGDVSVDVGPA